MADPWPLIHAEREVLAADPAPLTDEQWAAPSWCAGWSVREVLGPMTATAKLTPAAFLMAVTGRMGALDDLSGDGVAILRERG